MLKGYEPNLRVGEFVFFPDSPAIGLAPAKAESAKPEKSEPAKPALVGAKDPKGKDASDKDEPEPDKPSGGAEVVRLDRFRKK